MGRDFSAWSIQPCCYCASLSPLEPPPLASAEHYIEHCPMWHTQREAMAKALGVDRVDRAAACESPLLLAQFLADTVFDREHVVELSDAEEQVVANEH